MLPILRSSDGMLVAFMEAKLLFEPGGKHAYENETPTNDFGIPDTVDEGKYSNGASLTDNNELSRSEEMKAEWN